MKSFKIALLVLCLFSSWHYSHAQAFSKLYIEGRPSMLFGSIQAINSNFYVTGVTTTIRSPYYNKALFGKIDGNGAVNFINSIIDSNSYRYDIFYNTLKRVLMEILLPLALNQTLLPAIF